MAERANHPAKGAKAIAPPTAQGNAIRLMHYQNDSCTRLFIKR